MEDPKRQAIQGLLALQGRGQLDIHFGHVLHHYKYGLPNAHYVDSRQRNYPIYDRL